jgi:nitric oxide reductase subunit C
MTKVAVALLLVAAYAIYSLIIYTKGTESDLSLSAMEQGKVQKGKALFQQYNCQACHQVYGLGGYLGPELTTAYSDKNRGEAYLKAILQSGGSRMPDFHFSPEQIDAIVCYLKYVDRTATPIKTTGSE